MVTDAQAHAIGVRPNLRREWRRRNSGRCNCVFDPRIGGARSQAIEVCPDKPRLSPAEYWMTIQGGK